MTRQLMTVMLACVLGCVGGDDQPGGVDDDQPGGGDDDQPGGGDGDQPGGGDSELPDDLLFESGFEGGGGSGCSMEALTDNGLWDAFGGSGACAGALHDADVVDDFAQAGGRSLRVNQKTGQQNGTDFRLVKLFGDRAELTIVGHVRVADDWRWSTADHKLFIFTDAGETAQNVYVNVRGQAGDGQHARLALASTPADAVFSDQAPEHLLTVGVWYRVRVHVVAGDQGRIDAWLTPEGQAEIELALSHEAGLPADVHDLPIGAIGGFKIDTTYNDGANIDQPMEQWFDSFAAY